jgi:hypothetical protein
MIKNLVKNVKMRFYEKAAKFEKKNHLGDFFSNFVALSGQYVKAELNKRPCSDPQYERVSHLGTK